jgi:hypothetical protein
MTRYGRDPQGPGHHQVRRQRPSSVKAACTVASAVRQIEF